jgi:hypothetical protein
MDSSDRRAAGYVLFLLGGLTGTFVALRRSRSGSRPSLQGLRRILDEAVEGVESAAGYVRKLVRPVHGILHEADALAEGVGRTVDSYRHIARGDGASFVEGVPAGAGPGLS